MIDLWDLAQTANFTEKELEAFRVSRAQGCFLRASAVKAGKPFPGPSPPSLCIAPSVGGCLWGPCALYQLRPPPAVRGLQGGPRRRAGLCM